MRRKRVLSSPMKLGHAGAVQARTNSVATAIIGKSTPENLTLIAAPHARAMARTLNTVNRAHARDNAVTSPMSRSVIAMSFFTIDAWARNVGSSVISVAAAIAAA